MSVVVLECKGTFVGVNTIFEGSIDGSIYFTVQAYRTVGNVAETFTGPLSATPAYAWAIPTAGIEYLRVRALEWVSGLQEWTIRSESLGSAPVRSGPSGGVTTATTSSVV